VVINEGQFSLAKLTPRSLHIFCNDRTLLLFPETEDPVRSEGITIPIIDNTFAYDQKVTEIQKYKLIFQEGLFFNCLSSARPWLNLFLKISSAYNLQNLIY